MLYDDVSYVILICLFRCAGLMLGLTVEIWLTIRRLGTIGAWRGVRLLAMTRRLAWYIVYVLILTWILLIFGLGVSTLRVLNYGLSGCGRSSIRVCILRVR